jgi:hypothetical protein
MRRDMDLIRELMLKLEAMPRKPGIVEELSAGEGEMIFEGCSSDEIDYHLNLIVEAGFLSTHGMMMSGAVLFDRLTWAGHDFVDSVRSPEVWAKTKKGAEAAGGFTVDLLKDLAKGFIKKQIEEYTGVKL